MCYSGKCAYENWMGDCQVPIPTDETCKYGHKIVRRREIMHVLSIPFYKIKHILKYIFSRKYRKWLKENTLENTLPF